jgi:(2Fe-2S) ferredoxin
MTSLQQIYADAQAKWRELQESELPVFFVGSATCGRAAGATEVLERLRSHIKAEKIKANVIEVGCLGPCSFEPLVIVQKSGAPGICYANVGPDEIIQILENYVLGDDPCPQWALGTMTPGQINGIVDFNEHPLMRRQVRNVLRNCGLIDPENVNHYLARDGYRGFLQALEIGPDKALGEVKESGLRGLPGCSRDNKISDL